MDKYDLQGNPIDLLEWSKLFEDVKYRRVAETTLPDGTWVSTVWIGIDHQFGDGTPLIFETMVFPSKEELNERNVDRHTTETEALAGHHLMVKNWARASLDTPSS